MNDPFLIDECLSPDLAAHAQAGGHHATHVAHRGRGSTKDWALMPLIRDEGFIFVTGNGRDFLKLYAAEEIHPGLIIDNLANKLVEVFEDGRVSGTDYPTASQAAPKR